MLERVGKEPAQHAHQLIGMSEGEVKIVHSTQVQYIIIGCCLPIAMHCIRGKL